MMQTIAKVTNAILSLKDIRELSNIPEKIQHALHPGVPVYFRVDILKALIADYMIRPDVSRSKYCIVSDIDVAPMNREQLFDKYTLKHLESSGYVFNVLEEPFSKAIENNFFIFDKEKEGLLKKITIILLSKQSNVLRKKINRQ